jgi:hypothetical protein
MVESLKNIASIKARHKRWMSFTPAEDGRHKLLYSHPVYGIQLSSFLDGKSFGSSLRRVGWMYFLRDHRGRLACGEVSSVSGKHKDAQVSEGPFVRKTFALINKSIRDRRIPRSGYEVRSLRVESAHLFCLWFRIKRREEYFIPITSGSATLKAGKWVTRKEFSDALLSEGLRVPTAHERMSTLVDKFHAATHK